MHPINLKSTAHDHTDCNLPPPIGWVLC